MSGQAGFKEELITQIKGIALLALSVFCYFGLEYTHETGVLGEFINNVMRTLVGDTALVAPFLLGVLALKTMLPHKIMNLKGRFIGVILLLLLFTVAFHFQQLLYDVDSLKEYDNFYWASYNLGIQDTHGGGLVGALFSMLLFLIFEEIGSYIVLATLALVSVLLITNVSLTQIFNMLKKFVSIIWRLVKSLLNFLQELYQVLILGAEEETEKKRDEEEYHNKNWGETGIWETSGPDQDSMPPSDTPVRSASDNLAGQKNTVYQTERTLYHKQPEEEREDISVATGKDSISPREYQLPPFNLLTKSSQMSHQNQNKNIKQRARLLEDTLHSFGVNARVINVDSGPTVTRFEVQPEAGVKVSKIINLSDDIALNLAAPDIRIEAPIPGKAALGIEVPNKIISLVYLREVLEDPAFKNYDSSMAIAIGNDITGVPVVTSLEEMPHLLIAGATGAGKSVCLNSVITSILFKARPDEVKFLMVDPKMVELAIFNGIPHLISPVVTDPKKASVALKNMVKEMNRRYDLFAREGVRDIDSFNEKVIKGEIDGEKLPSIVVIVDELADLMLVSPGEVEDTISRLAQMSRASGIYLVLATQRPSVDVLTGIIKANITSRIAFTVSSQVDSRTILDMGGAEKLLGRGDMLFSPVGSVKPMRVQGAFLSEKDLQALVDFIKPQGEEDFSEEVLSPEKEVEEWEEVDELFADAVELVVRTGQASISLIQRRFRVGYTRAARIMDDLERKGVVGKHEGSKPREIIISPEQASRLYEEYKEKLS